MRGCGEAREEVSSSAPFFKAIGFISSLKMPATLVEQEEGMRKFRTFANFPRVIGAVDCTNIRIKKIRTDEGQSYINRKGYPSINVQVVCDADLKIMDIVARWRGSVHDSRIFRESRLKQRFEAGAFSGLLLGDSGYPCTPYLFTPLLNPQTEAEQRYNRSHIRTRNTIERCFGLWKQRFRCLLRGMYGDIETARKTIVACALLHNIAIDMREDLFPGDDLNNEHLPRESNIPVQPYISNATRGSIRRRQFIETHFT
ncbi:putative nuclease HARBI1 [Manduca sexta]|uniref:putative nuclease HARBI1 n=1 Tax=Manduca sexta TaxID=7130 RepID=UPI00188F8D3C|nr:putative nuclease HARBI1 [Manduca sexta]